jgi:hypothetical protein
MKKTNFKAFDNRVEIVSRKINENGYLVIECLFARTGIQERYGAEIREDFEALKLYKEYRSPEEIFKPSVLKEFRNITITNDHPQGLLTPENTKYHAIGFVSSEIQIIDKTYLKCEITIYDAEAIEDIQNGKVQLSAGYVFSILMVEGEEYDYIQTDIKPNHIAIVEAGRCGDSCSIAMDSTLNKGKNMKKKIVFKRMLPNGSEEVIVEIEVDESSAIAVQEVADLMFDRSKKMLEASQALDEDMKTIKESSEAKDTEIEAKNEEIKAKDQTIAELEAEKDTRVPVVANDSAVIGLAHSMAGVMIVAMDLGIDTSKKKVCELKKEVILKVNPDLDLSDKSPEYIGFAFDNVATQLKNADKSFLIGLDIEAQKLLDSKQVEQDSAHADFKSKFGGNK